MPNPIADEQVAHLFDPAGAGTLHVLGPTIQFIVLPAANDTPCIMRGSIPPGVVVPLHSPPDPETFVQLSGEVDGLTESEDGFHWTSIMPGEVFHVPGGAKHAFRNRSRAPSISIVTTTPALGRFFLEVGSPIASDKPPTVETIQRFLETSNRYGHWNASPEENAAVGIALPAAA
jgi:quercetin dioxygenase-like cupin family protein